MMMGLLGDLEVFQELLKDLRPILTSFAPIDFRRSVFVNPSFWNVTFVGDVLFSSCQFRKRTWFDETVFPGKADFFDSKFDQAASFNGTKFHKEARFDQATFGSFVTFGSDFHHEVWFDRAVFKSWVSVAVGSGIRLRFDDARLADVRVDRSDFAGSTTVQADSAEGSEQATLSPPLVTFHNAAFTREAELRTRGDIDVSLARMVLRNPLSLASWRGKMRLVSLRFATLEAPLVIGDGVDLGGCRMTHATGLDRLRIVEADPQWRTYHRRHVVADELASVRHARSETLPEAPTDTGGEFIQDLEANANTVESVYRQLRTALESSKAFSAAADFFYGEMEMRRLAAPLLSVERMLLAAYKLTSGYGLRASRALVAYIAVLLLTGAALRYGTTWFVADPATVAASPGLHFSNYWDAVAIAARNSVSFFGGITGGLTAAGTVLMYTARLVGPTAFALIILALRSRVQR